MVAPHPSLRQKADQVVPSVIVGLYALLASVGALHGGMWAALCLSGAGVLAVLAGIARGGFPALSRPVTRFVAALLALAVATSVLAFDPSVSIYASVKIASVLIPLSFLFMPQIRQPSSDAFIRHADRVAIAMILGLGVVALSLLWLYETQGHGELVGTKLNRGLSYVLLLLPAVGAALWLWPEGEARKRRLLTILLLFAAAIALGLTRSRASQMGALAGGMVFLAALYAPRLVRWGLAGLVGLSLLFPLYVQSIYALIHNNLSSIPPSWHHRMEIWDSLSTYIWKAPLFGMGPGVTPLLPPESAHPWAYAIMNGPVAHPHNAAAQVWLEMGLFGALWAAVFALWLLARAAALPLRLRPFAYAAFGGGLVVVLTAYNLWTDSWLSALAMTLFAFALLGQRRGN